MDKNSLLQALQGLMSQDGASDGNTPASPLEMQDGDKMHPMDAIAHITSQMQGPTAPAGVELATGPQLFKNRQGQMEANTVTSAPLGHLLGLKEPTPVSGANYFQAAKQAGLSKLLPSGLMRMPDGTPFVDKEAFMVALSALKGTQNPNNPPVTKDEFIQTYGGTEKQWKAAGLDETGTMPFTKVRGLISKESADAMTSRAASQKLNILMQYGGPGAVKQAASDAYSRLSNISRADGVFHVIDQIQNGEADKRQRALLLTEIARVINPTGVVTNEALNNMATDTAGQKINDWKEWMLNQAEPTDFRGFLPSLRNMLDQEKDINQGIFMNATQMGLNVLRPSMPGGVHAANVAISTNPTVSPPQRIRVMNTQTGQIGTMPESKFDASKYRKL